MKDAPENSNIVSIRDFMNHETRISLVENAIINIDRRFEHVEKRFEQSEKRLERVENKIDSHFKWTIGLIITMFGGLILTKFF